MVTEREALPRKSPVENSHLASPLSRGAGGEGGRGGGGRMGRMPEKTVEVCFGTTNIIGRLERGTLDFLGENLGGPF